MEKVSILFITNAPKTFCTDRVQMPRVSRRYRRRPAYRRRPTAGRRKYAIRRKARYQNKGSLFIMRKALETTLSNSAIGVLSVGGGPLPNPIIQLGTAVSTGISAFYDIPFSMSFRLSHLVNSTDITQISDMYKIVGAYVRINHTGAQFSTTAGGLATATVSNKPWIQHYTDHDDATPPGVTQVLEHMGTKTKTFKNENSYISMKARPVPQEDVTGGYIVPARSRFINSANPTVEHFGIKGCLKNVYLPAPTDGSTQFRVDVALAVVAKDFQ